MRAASLHSVRTWSQALCSAVFMTALFAPLVDQLARPSRARNTVVEMRAPAPRPRLPRDLGGLRLFPRRFEAWHKDTFGLRDVLLRWHNIVRWSAFSTSPTPRIEVGRNGWIFTTSRSALEDHRGALPMSDGLLAEWKHFLERRRDWLAERGIRYALVAAPNKNQVYPERLPARWRPVGPTRLDQLTSYLGRHSDVQILDLRPVLRTEALGDRGDDFACFPLGTHWTDRGAHAAYAAIVERLAPVLAGSKPLPRDAFDVVRRVDQGDSWARRLYMGERLHQANVTWTVREPKARCQRETAGGRQAFYVQPDGKGLPKALLLHDSFGLPLRPWLAEHFSELDCSWTSEFDPARIDESRPDVVIQLYAEVSLVNSMPEPTREEEGGRKAARFDECTDVVWRLPADWSLSAGESQGRLDCDRTATVARDRASLVFERTGGDEMLYLPEMGYPADETWILRAEVESSVAGPLDVYYKTYRDRDYDQSLHGNFDRGRSLVYLVFPPMDATDRLALRIGIEPGRYVLHSFEIRREPKSGAPSTAPARDQPARDH